MKKIIFIILLPFCGIAQDLTFSDIVFGKKHTLSETEEYLTKKGYDFKRKEDFIVSRLQQYIFVSESNSGIICYCVVIDEQNDEITQINIKTSNRSTYNLLRTKIKELGYEIIKENPHHLKIETINTTYKKGDSQISFSTSETDKKVPVYEISFY
jgi:hypothetical protein